MSTHIKLQNIYEYLIILQTKCYLIVLHLKLTH